MRGRVSGRSAHVAADSEVTIETAAARLEGNLVVPDDAVGVVLFAHGSGRSRHSPLAANRARSPE